MLVRRETLAEPQCGEPARFHLSADRLVGHSMKHLGAKLEEQAGVLAALQTLPCGHAVAPHDELGEHVCGMLDQPGKTAVFHANSGTDIPFEGKFEHTYLLLDALNGTFCKPVGAGIGNGAPFQQRFRNS